MRSYYFHFIITIGQLHDLGERIDPYRALHSWQNYRLRRLRQSQMYSLLHSEARHDLTDTKVAVKIINKLKMKNKNMISKVPENPNRSNERSRFWDSSITHISSNFLKYLIPPLISMLSWKWLKEASFITIYKTMILLKRWHVIFSNKLLKEFRQLTYT